MEYFISFGMGHEAVTFFFESIGEGVQYFYIGWGAIFFGKLLSKFVLMYMYMFLYITTRDTLVTPLHHVEKSIF